MGDSPKLFFCFRDTSGSSQISSVILIFTGSPGSKACVPPPPPITDSSFLPCLLLNCLTICSFLSFQIFNCFVAISLYWNIWCGLFFSYWYTDLLPNSPRVNIFVFVWHVTMLKSYWFGIFIFQTKYACNNLTKIPQFKFTAQNFQVKINIKLLELLMIDGNWHLYFVLQESKSACICVVLKIETAALTFF